MKHLIKVLVLFLLLGCSDPTRISPPPKIIYINQQPTLDVVSDSTHRRVIVPLRNISLEDRHEKGTLIRYNGYLIYSRYKLEYFLKLIQDKHVAE